MLGNILIVISIIFSLVALFSYYKTYKGDAKHLKIARNSYYIMTVAVVASFLLLLYLTITHQFQYSYIYGYSSVDLPFGLLLSSSFAGQEGSFLLWILFTAVLGLIMIKQLSSDSKVESSFMMFFTLTILFLLLMVSPLLKSPFEYIWSETSYVNLKFLNQSLLGAPVFNNFIFSNPDSNAQFLKFSPQLKEILDSQNIVLSELIVDGKGLNPMLRNFWMQIHPPILFLGFALTSALFAFAGSALLRNTYEDFIKPSLTWTIVTSLILGLGIIIGGYWAYGVLGWGGYWAWDPVENASLIPWIICLAVIHTLLVQKQAKNTGYPGTFVKTNLVLLILTYLLVVFSTFLTRSGILSDSSVHSFVSPGAIVYTVLVVFIGFFTLLSIYLLAKRWRDISKLPKKEFAVLSKDSALLYGALVLVASALAIFVGTTAPIFGQSVEIRFYNDMNLPLVILMGLLIGLSFYINWTQDNQAGIIKRSLPSLVISVILTAIVVLLSPLSSILYILYFFSATLAIVVNVHMLIKRFKLRSNRIGGHLAHLGLGVMLIGILISGVFSQRNEIDLKKNVPKEIFNRELEFTGVNKIPNSEKFAFNVQINNGTSIENASPVMYNSDYNGNLMREPEILTGFTEDFYMSPIAYSPGNNNGGGHQVTISKGETVDHHGIIISFNGFEMNQNHSQPNAASEMRVGAKVTIEKDGKSYDKVLTMILKDGEREYPAVYIEPPDLTVRLANLDPAGKIVLLLNNNSKESQVKQASPQLTIEVSTKPFISLVWIGVIIISLGFIFSSVTYFKSKQ